MTLSIEDMQKLVARELSLGARLGHTALLVVGASVAALTAVLWLTEPSLPLRTHIAFGAIVIVGGSWTAYAWWVLTNRRVLLANQRVIASWLAAAFSGLFLVGAVILRDRVGTGGAVVSTTLFGIACVNLVAARRRFKRLAAHRDSLMKEMGE
jgi:hypothetical protein